MLAASVDMLLLTQFASHGLNEVTVIGNKKAQIFDDVVSDDIVLMVKRQCNILLAAGFLATKYLLQKCYKICQQ